MEADIYRIELPDASVLFSVHISSFLRTTDMDRCFGDWDWTSRLISMSHFLCLDFA